jgi:hypothetical protein
MFKCRKCDIFVSEEDLFCKNCGQRLNDEAKVIVPQERNDCFNSEDTFENPEKRIGEGKKKENKSLIFKDIKVGIVIVLILLTLTLVSYTSKSILYSDEAINERTMSTFAQQEDLTYFSHGKIAMGSHAITGAFYRFNEDNPVPEKINDEVGSYLSVKGDWIYFVDSKDDRGNIYKIKTDGTEKIKLSNEQQGAFDLRLHGNYLYYKDSYEGYRLCRILLDGGSKENISNEVLSFYIQGDWIYYVSPSHLGTLYKMKLDGRDSKKVTDINGPVAYINENYIYYTAIDTKFLNNGNPGLTEQYYLYNEGPLYRVRKDGTDRELVIDDRIFNIYVRKSYIYYQPFSESISVIENRKAYRTDLNGGNKTELPLEGNFLGMVGKWIYYSAPEGYELYRTTLDFKKMQKIETDLFKPTIVE